jgi:hypothetical protein
MFRISFAALARAIVRAMPPESVKRTGITWFVAVAATTRANIPARTIRIHVSANQRMRQRTAALANGRGGQCQQHRRQQDNHAITASFVE